MRQVILTVGLPASGKTTWAKKILTDNPGKYKRINKDDLRSMLDNGRWSTDNEIFIIRTRDILIEQALKDGYSVIIDDTNLSKTHHTKIQYIVDRYASDTGNIVSFETKFFNTPVNECIIRDAQRLNSVGEKVINNMYNQYKNLYNFDNIDAIEQDINNPKAIIVDIDGTVADKLERDPFDWGKVSNDKPKEEIINIVRMFLSNNYNVIFLSGRDYCCYEDTLEWIKKYIYFEPFNNAIQLNSIKLFMRAANDNRKDSIVKKELFMEHVYNNFYVSHVFDDRNQTVSCWRSMGLTCLQVAQGNF